MGWRAPRPAACGGAGAPVAPRGGALHRRPNGPTAGRRWILLHAPGRRANVTVVSQLRRLGAMEGVGRHPVACKENNEDAYMQWGVGLVRHRLGPTLALTL